MVAFCGFGKSEGRVTDEVVGKEPAAGEIITGDVSREPRPATWHHWLAGLMRRSPWITRLLMRVVKQLQPRVTVGVVGVLIDERQERVFLVEHLYHPKTPWGLPGGWMDRDEEPAETVVREFREETGLRIRPKRLLLARLSTIHRRHLDMAVLVALDGDQQAVHLNHELLDWRWASRDDLPPLADFRAEAVRAGFEAVTGMSAHGDGRPASPEVDA
jgi:8-oxo-dGTP diphosphatase